MLRRLQPVLVWSTIVLVACQEPTGTDNILDPETPGDSTAPPTTVFRVNPGTIAFESTRDGERGIYLTSHTGTPVAFLTEGEAPTWSSDGKRIAFHRADGGVYVIHVDDSTTIRIGDGSEPAWSPDDQRIAFNGPGGLFVGNADGSGSPTLLLPDTADLPRPPWYDPASFSPGWVESPTWSPDGQRIAFVYTAPFSWDWGFEQNAYVMNADGTDIKLLSGWCTITSQGQGVLPCPTKSPTWSPDGGLITVVTRDFNSTTGSLDVVLASIGVGGWDERQIHYRGYKGYIGRPAWSIDGSNIIFDQYASPSVQDSRDTRIFLLDNATGNVRRIVADDAAARRYGDSSPMWWGQPSPEEGDDCRGCWDY